MANYKVTYLQDHTPFDELNVPRCKYKHNWLNMGYQFPFGLKFNKTYYKYDGSNLTAFRILAYTICDETNSIREYPIYYLVQLPNQSVRWIKDFITNKIRVYNSIEEYVTSGGADFVDLHWLCWVARFNVRSVHDDTYFFDDDFWTIKTGAVVPSKGAYFNRFVATEDGFFANIGKDSYHNHYGEEGIFLDKKTATQNLLDDMDVVDFENEPITIKMNVLDNTPKLLKLKFVE
jgi:hypothetical protein